MVRVGVSVEGTTEVRFIDMVLAPYLAKKEVYVSAISMRGDVKLDRVRAELERIAYSYDFTSTLYDFYGFKGKSLQETKHSLEQKIQQCVPDKIREKVIPYIQMYEFEGLLFSSPEAISNQLNETGLIQWAESVLADFGDDPEKINDSTITAPSKRLEAKVNYRKTTHSPNIANEIGIQAIRERCAGFDDWLSRLERLA